MTTKITELSPSGRKLLEDTDENGFLRADSGGLKGGPAIQVRRSLVAQGLLEQRRNDSGFGDPCHAFGGDVLRITDKGRAAIGATGAQKPAARRQNAAPASYDATKAPRMREGSKQAKLVDMLRRPSGASIAQVCDTFGWLPHTARAAISTLPKKAGVTKPTSTLEGRERIYKLPATSDGELLAAANSYYSSVQDEEVAIAAAREDA